MAKGKDLELLEPFYHNPSVLIFDEATSALDNLTEQKIIENIFMLREQKTIITIAHRLSTIRSADQIYFLKKGMLAGSAHMMSYIHQIQILKD